LLSASQTENSEGRFDKKNYASIVTANTSATSEPTHDTAPAYARIEDEGTSDSPVTACPTAGADRNNSLAQEENPDTNLTSAASAPPEDEDGTATNTAHCADIEKPQQGTETSELCDESSTRQSRE
jgi:hypothetical protein